MTVTPQDLKKIVSRIKDAVAAIDASVIKDLSTAERIAYYRIQTALTHGVLQATDLARPYVFTTVPTKALAFPWTTTYSTMMQWVVSAANGAAVAYGLSEYEAWHLIHAAHEGNRPCSLPS
jgi:hypothetical protein